MAPATSTNSTNRNVSVTTKPLLTSVVPQRAREVLEKKLSSKEVIGLENKYSAHNYHPLPVVLDRGLGAKVWDVEGKEYIDMLSAYSAVNQGHCHPAILQTLVTQSSKLTLSSRAFYNSVFGRFAKVVTEMFGYDMVLPMNTGAEAVETALKLARKWGYKVKKIPAGKARIFSVEGNFHGRTLAVISMSTDPESRTGFGPYLERVGPTYSTAPSNDEDGESYRDEEGADVKTIRYGVIEDLEEALSLYGHETAAFLIEPIQGEAGIVVPPTGYLASVHALCKKHNVLLICDEIQTGLCRTGRMLACEWEGVRPDLVLLGKALSGGVYPVSAVLGSEEVMLTIRPGEHGSTYGGNPLGCAVAVTALGVLVDEGLAERAERLGKVFREGLGEFRKHALIKEVRGRGLLNALVFEEEASEKGRTAWELCLLLKERGVLAKPTHRNIIRFAPPLVIEEEDLRRAVRIVGECLRDLDELEVIPGETLEEVGHVDELAC
ncbi:ornithine aminotransferase [Coprinopsis marcescibilis]|uniref:ornithine aminotransferase n=1 Tax=Coprinopsis marcescibilis TaxID=230819 RepID=A0A5C3L8Z9_COPMA|nr:ornithine aminotransferase [Coprinopsis marcescibilis]